MPEDTLARYENEEVVEKIPKLTQVKNIAKKSAKTALPYTIL